MPFVAKHPVISYRHSALLPQLKWLPNFIYRICSAPLSLLQEVAVNTYEQKWHPVAHKESHAVEPKLQPLRLLGLLRYFIPPFFFCWHRKMSRPFTRDGETYRVCLRCGVRRQFDLEQWRTKGNYYRPGIRQDQNEPSQGPKPRYQLVKGGTRLDSERRRMATLQCSIHVNLKSNDRQQ